MSEHNPYRETLDSAPKREVSNPFDVNEKLFLTTEEQENLFTAYNKMQELGPEQQELLLTQLETYAEQNTVLLRDARDMLAKMEQEIEKIIFELTMKHETWQLLNREFEMESAIAQQKLVIDVLRKNQDEYDQFLKGDATLMQEKIFQSETKKLSQAGEDVKEQERIRKSYQKYREELLRQSEYIRAKLECESLIDLSGSR